MSKSLVLGLSVFALAASGNALCAEEAPADTGPLAADNFSATLALMNDYLFRGISNSDGPAIQGSLDWAWNGFFVGAWASNTEFSDANIEIDYYAGYTWNWAGIDWTLQGIYYTFPGEEEDYSEGLDPGTGVEADYGEINIGAAHAFEGLLAPTLGVNYYYSPDTFGEDGDNHTVEGNFGLTLPGDWGLYTNVGYTDFDGDLSGGYDYVYFNAGVTKTVLGFTLDLGYHGTDESSDLEAVYVDEPLPGDHNFRDLIDGKVVFTVSRTF